MLRDTNIQLMDGIKTRGVAKPEERNVCVFLLNLYATFHVCLQVPPPILIHVLRLKRACVTPSTC